MSIVIPVFNEQDNVAPLWQEIQAAIAPTGATYEIIVVDDGSRDRTVDRLVAAAGRDPHLVLVRLAANYGQTAALAAGFDRARGRIIVPLDGDRQNDPAEIPRMVARLGDEVDVVCGWRRDRQDRFLRTWASRAANHLISRVTGVALHDYGCTLKAFKAEYVKALCLWGEMHRFLPVWAAWHGARIIEMPVHHRPRVAGVTKYGLDRTFRVLLDLLLVQFLTKYRGRALRFFGRWIWAPALSAAGCGLVALGGWLSGGWIASTWLLLGALAAMTAAVILCVALCAELLWRIYDESQGLRPYRVAEVLSGSADHPAEANALPARGD